MTPTLSPSRLDRLRRLATGETTAAALVVGAALVAFAWANSPWRAAYATVSGTVLGGAPGWHLDLTVADWAADGLLAVFFLVVGLELKQEVAAGSLRDPRRAAVPVLAAVGGMAAPALVYLVTVHAAGAGDAARGWAVPTATDIAFALAVLGLFGRGLPAPVRTFLLTLAVVDDLLAVVVIAVVYTSSIAVGTFLGGVAVVGVFAWVVRWRRPPWWLLVVLGAGAWVLVNASGVHPTVAGVLLGFAVPVRPVHRETLGRAERYEHAWRPVSSGVALPVFAFFAAGVTLVGGTGVAGVVREPVTLAVALGLVVGKPLGVLGTTWLAVRLTPLRLAPGLTMRDMAPVGALGGIGFTVALLVAGLAFASGPHPDPARTDAARAAVLAGSVVSAAVAAALLRRDARRARAAGSLPPHRGDPGATQA